MPVTILAIGINLIWLFPWAWIAAQYPTHARNCVIVALGPLAIVALLAGAGRKLPDEPP
jgi:hypothetical protein